MPDGRGILLPCKAKKRRQYFVYCKIFQRGRPAKDPLRRWRMVVNTGSKVLLNFFQKIAGSRGRAPDALRTASRSEAFRAQPAEGGLLARDERGTLSPVKRFFRVNCREVERGGFLQVKKPPCRKKYGTVGKRAGLTAGGQPLLLLFIPVVGSIRTVHAWGHTDRNRHNSGQTPTFSDAPPGSGA